MSIKLYRLQSKGVVPYFAVPNFTPGLLANYQEIESKLSIRCRFVAVENQFDILNSEGPKQVGAWEYAIKNEIFYVDGNPLARGLSNKVDNEYKGS